MGACSVQPEMERGGIAATTRFGYSNCPESKLEIHRLTHGPGGMERHWISGLRRPEGRRQGRSPGPTFLSGAQYPGSGLPIRDSFSMK
jgi:hypothetical protein